MRPDRRVFVKQKVGFKIGNARFRGFCERRSEANENAICTSGRTRQQGFALRVILGCRFLRFAFHSRIVFSFPPKNETIAEGFTPALSPSETISSTSLSNSARISATEFNALSPERFVLVE